MSVGTQSIRRAAEKAAEAEETSPKAAELTAAEGKNAEPAAKAVKEKPAESAASAETKTAAKKTTAKTEPKAAKKTTGKKSTARKSAPVKASVIPEISPQVADGMKLTGKERYQVNDELPTYLL